MHDETSDASTEMMDMAVDSKIRIFLTAKKCDIFSYQEGLTSLETPWHQPKP
jgi:hypothetical protein